MQTLEERIPRRTVLFEGSSTGEDGITLNDNYTNYDEIEVIYTTNNGTYQTSAKMCPEISKYITLLASYGMTVGMAFLTKLLVFSAKTVTLDTDRTLRYELLSSKTINIMDTTSNQIIIKKIIGYKY